MRAVPRCSSVGFAHRRSQLARPPRSGPLRSFGGKVARSSPMESKAEVPLAQRRCAACTGQTPQATKEEIERLKGSISSDWEVLEVEREKGGSRLRREVKAKNFVDGLSLFQRIGDIAEKEGHHPDLHLTNYRNVAIEVNTHAVKGLTENDFILAAKIDELLPKTKL